MIPDRHRGGAGAARGFMRDIIDLAEEQRWTVRAKDNGTLFIAPQAVKRPGHEVVFVMDPKNDSHEQRVVRTKLIRAGLKFAEEAKTAVTAAATTTPAPAKAITPPPADVDHFAEIDKRMDQIFTHIGEVQDLVKAARNGQKKLMQLRELLKEI